MPQLSRILILILLLILLLGVLLFNGIVWCVCVSVGCSLEELLEGELHIASGLLKNLKDRILVIKTHLLNLLELRRVFFTWWSRVRRRSRWHAASAADARTWGLSHHSGHHGWVHSAEWVSLSSSSGTSTCSSGSWESTHAAHSSCTSHTLHHLHCLLHGGGVHHLPHHLWVI